MMNTLSVREKIAYGTGDAACSFVWQTVMLFLAFFYTDVYGLSPAHMGTMFLVVRVIDAITDPLIGAMVDRTQSKHGKYRPYLIWMAVPFALSCIGVFYTPDFSDMGKIVYAYCSYIFLTLMYTAINVPYCAMANSLSKDSKERTELQSYRFAMTAGSGVFIVSIATTLVEWMGDGDQQKGYMGAISVMSSIAVFLFLFCFFNTKEKYIAESPQSGSIYQDLACLSKNRAWRTLFSQNVMMLVGFVIKDAVIIYYVASVVQRPDLMTLFMVLGKVAGVMGAVMTVPLFGRLDKVNAYRVINVILGIICILLYFVSSDQVVVIFLFVIMINFLQMSATPLIWSMMSDVVDDEKYRSNRSLSGMVFSTNLFAMKLGVAIGGAAVGWSLSAGGYVGGLPTQSQSALVMIHLLFTVIPGLVFLLIALIMHFYPLGNNAYLKEQKGY